MELKVGVVVHWSEKGYGFLFNDEVNRRVFFHASAWNRATDPEVGEEATFQFAPGQIKSKPNIAVNVTPTGKRIPLCGPKTAVTVTEVGGAL